MMFEPGHVFIYHVVIADLSTMPWLGPPGLRPFGGESSLAWAASSLDLSNYRVGCREFQCCWGYSLPELVQTLVCGPAASVETLAAAWVWSMEGAMWRDARTGRVEAEPGSCLNYRVGRSRRGGRRWNSFQGWWCRSLASGGASGREKALATSIWR